MKRIIKIAPKLNTDMKENNKQKSDIKSLSAVCGLFCAACSIYIGTNEDPGRLKNIADRHGVKSEDMQCHGCRAEKRSYWCKDICKIKPCADEKKIDFCIECNDYPCDMLQDFQKARPHRIELWENQRRIAEIGYEKWFSEKIKHYSCPECNTLNSAYDIACRNCGIEPGCEYVRLHKKAIEKTT